MPRLTALLDTDKNHDAAEVLGRIGAPAAAALPRLRQMLAAGHVWTRMHAAAAIHDIGGPAEAEVVLSGLLEVWEENDSTVGRGVLDCLRRMGSAAAPALPRIHAEPALARRGGGFFASVQDDEALQRAGRAGRRCLLRARSHPPGTGGPDSLPGGRTSPPARPRRAHATSAADT
ncbi:hypothetical protein [Kitasatospora sp. NPDC057223]|uniref:hypothetical protein n=1 Tax=Kitasatospora sp. NPDC057223 TaxID=3346055 RepID=UPI003635009F